MLARIALLAVVVALAISAVAVDSAVAAKGGNAANGGKGGGNGGTTTAVLTVSPNPAPLGTAVTISGSGFTPGPVKLLVDLNFPYDTVTADAGGNVTLVYSRPLGPGLHSVVAYQEGKKGMEVKAWTTFTVEP